MARRLIFAPHADDEVMGCGGLLAKHPEECTVIVVSDSGSTRMKEFEAARSILGYEKFQHLGFEDSRIGKDTAALVGAFDRVLSIEQPDEVYLPYPSLHQDHVAVYEAGMRSCRISMTADHWFPPTVLVYDVATYDVNLYPSDLRWNMFESLTREHVEAKVAAIHAYLSENVDGCHPVNGIKETAKALGSARRMEYAEQYALIRYIRSC